MKKVGIHRFLTALTAVLMVTIAFSTLAIAEKENVLDEPIDDSHTVLMELKAASNCGFCPDQENAIPNLDGDFVYVTMAFQSYYGAGWNDAAENREAELDEGDGFPTSYYDGGYTKVFGGGAGGESSMQNAIDNCAARSVADVDLDLSVYWLGDAEMDIELEVSNTGSSTYDGHVRIYVTEIESRWDNYDGDPFQQALLSIPKDEDFTVSGSSTWDTTVTYNGDTDGYGDITSDNIKVIAAVFDQSSDYADDAISATPITNIAPSAEFSYTPLYPEELETITFTDDSADSDGSIVNWNWDFGDGSTSTLQNPTHSYSDSGYYTVSLTVEDDNGAVDEYSTMILVSEPGETVIASQSVFDRGFPIRHAVDGDWAGAQNFLATTSQITKANLYLRSFGTPEFDLTVELRENDPEGTLLDTVTFTPAEVPTNWDWFTVDFTDTAVDSGTDYFIVVPPAPSGVTSSFGYEWGYAFGNQYDDGRYWFTRDGGNVWRDLPAMYEFAFSVFGN